MRNPRRFHRPSAATGLFCMTLLLVAALLGGCSSELRDGDANTLRVTGSDTMVDLANAWREAYSQSHPDISMQVNGGGSQRGIVALSQGQVEIATSSRAMEPAEIQTAKQKTGKDPKQFVVGLDALSIYVHPDNPIELISIGELAQIYGRKGTIRKWSELGVENAACKGGDIVVVSRQSSSGTYQYFKEAVLGKTEDYRQGMSSQTGSADLVTLISHTFCGIGYSGMAFKSPEVKIVKVSKEKGGPAIEPSVETALDGSYPISRPLFLYTLGEPKGAVAEFIKWVQAEEGQKILERQGFVPLKQEQPSGS